MRIGNIKAIIVAVFGLALLAGAAAGMLAARYVGKGPAQPIAVEGTSLSDELQLSPEQREQIRAIWEKMRGIADDAHRQAEWAQQQQDEQILKMLNDDQKGQYQKIHAEYQERFTAIASKREAAFDDAVRQTKERLNESQRKRYEEILSRRLGQEGGGARPEPSEPPSGFSASQPS